MAKYYVLAVKDGDLWRPAFGAHERMDVELEMDSKGFDYEGWEMIILITQDNQRSINNHINQLNWG